MHLLYIRGHKHLFRLQTYLLRCLSFRNRRTAHWGLLPGRARHRPKKRARPAPSEPHRRRKENAAPGPTAAARGERRGGAGRDQLGLGQAGRRSAATAALTVIRHHRLALVQLLRGPQMVLDALELRRQRGKRRGCHRAATTTTTGSGSSRSRAWSRSLPLPARGVETRARGCWWRGSRKARPLLGGRRDASPAS